MGRSSWPVLPLSIPGLRGNLTLLLVAVNDTNFISHRNVYSGSSATGSFVQDTTTSINKPSVLLDNGKIFGKTRPTYADYSTDQIVSVKDEGALGDGTTDDTAALQAVFDNVRPSYHIVDVR